MSAIPPPHGCSRPYSGPMVYKHEIFAAVGVSNDCTTRPVFYADSVKLDIGSSLVVFNRFHYE